MKCSYEEIFTCTERTRRLFYLLGLFPFLYRKLDGGYGYMWRRWQPVVGAHVLLVVIFSGYSTWTDWIAYIPGDNNRMEKFAFGGIVLNLLLGVFLNVSRLLVGSGQRWCAYFLRWSTVDGLLDFRFDPHLRRLSRISFSGFAAYVIFLLLMATTTGVWLLLWPQQLPMGPTYPFALAIYAFHFSVCLILPELFCVFSCLAVISRLKLLCGQLGTHGLVSERRWTSHSLRPEVTHEVERLRMAYQLLMDSVTHINTAFGPFLLTTCIFHVLPLPLLVYSFMKQGETGVTVKMIKVTAFVTDFVRVATMCLVGQMVHDQSAAVYAVLRDAPSEKLSKSTNQEIIFFMNCIRLSSPKISAWGFLHIDIGYLQSVVGVMVAYTITIWQFEMSTCPSIHSNCSFNASLQNN